VTGYAELLEESVDADGTAHLDVLKERAWDGVERIEAAREFAELLGQRDPTRTPIELQEIVERTIEDIRSLERNVEIRLEGADRSTPIAADSVVESIVRLLVENVVLGERESPDERTDRLREMTVSVGEQDDRVSIRVFEGELDAESDFEELPSEDALGIESVGMSSSDLYLIQGFVEGYGGSVRLTTDGSEGMGFAVEFPVRESFIGDAVGIVEPPA
jgi:signal transduction histidine kinase